MTLTPAFGICHPTSLSIVLPNVLFSFYSHVLIFLFHFRASHWQESCLLLPEPLVSHCLACVCVLNHNPVNPSSNGVCWETYQTWPLGLLLWLIYRRKKQGFNTCQTAFYSLLWKMLDLSLVTNELCSYCICMTLKKETKNFVEILCVVAHVVNLNIRCILMQLGTPWLLLTYM